MKNLLFLAFISCTMLLFSCVERQPAAPAHNAPLRTTATTAKTPATAMPTGDFVFVKNPVLGFVKNLGLSSEQATALHELRNGYVTQMAAFPKLSNGKFDLDKVKPVMDKMSAEIKSFLGPQKYKRYQTYNAWHNKQLFAKQ